MHKKDSEVIDPKDIGLKIDEIYIGWSSDIGFGVYVVEYRHGRWQGDSECMDRGGDRSFLEELLRKVSEIPLGDVKIVG